jgi:hypothetical protein
MKAGVSKSGSPALRLMMSRPSDASFLASVLTAIVAEGFSFSMFSLNCIGSSAWIFRGPQYGVGP